MLNKSKKILSFMLALVMLVGLFPVAALAIGEDSYVEITPLTTVSVNDFAELQAAVSTMSANSSREIVLLNNIGMTAPVTIAQGRNVTLLGNGHVLTQQANARHFTINNTGMLCIRDVTLTVPSDTTFNHGGIAVGATGVLNMLSGSIISGNTSNSGGGVHVTGTGRFTLDGGVIRGNTSSHSGGVFIDGHGTFIMISGAISYNTATSAGGGVHVNSSGTFRMHNGEIVGNTASTGGGGILIGSNLATTIMYNGIIRNNSTLGNFGGGVSNAGIFALHDGSISNNKVHGNSGGGVFNSGEFTMHGGSISNNTANTNGGGVHNVATFRADGSTVQVGIFTMNSGTISGNTAGSGGGVFNSVGEFTMHDGTISDNTAYANGGGISFSHTHPTQTGLSTLNGGTISGNRVISTATRNGGGGLGWITVACLAYLSVAPAVTFSTNTAATGLRINDDMNLEHNINANGRINPRAWTNSATVPHVFNNHDIRTIAGEGDETLPPPVDDYEFHPAYMFGDDRGNFRPSADITRAEVATILARTQLLDFEHGVQRLPPGMSSFNAFSDVNPDRWFYYYIAWAYDAGLVQGYAGRFRPNDPITREELAAIIARTTTVRQEGTTSFNDDGNISTWARRYVYTVYREGLMIGSGGNFRPGENITRAKTATAMNRILGRLDSRSAFYATDVAYLNYARPFPDVANTTWYFPSILAAANDHRLTRDSDGAIDWKAIIRVTE